MSLSLGLDLALVTVVLLLGRAAMLASVLGAVLTGLGLALGSLATAALGPDLARPLTLAVHFGVLWAGFALVGAAFPARQLAIVPLGIGAWLFLDISFWRTTGAFLDATAIAAPGQISPMVLILGVGVCLAAGLWFGRKIS